jgi:hypothetical protein
VATLYLQGLGTESSRVPQLASFRNPFSRNFKRLGLRSLEDEGGKEAEEKAILPSGDARKQVAAGSLTQSPQVAM